MCAYKELGVSTFLWNPVLKKNLLTQNSAFLHLISLVIETCVLFFVFELTLVLFVIYTFVIFKKDISLVKTPQCDVAFVKT